MARFALNHMCAPSLGLADFFALALRLGATEVEIRNDLEGNAILDGTSPETVKSLATRAGLTIISINALQRFNEWTPAREAEARALADHASRCGAKALVLVPTNDGSGRVNGERQANLRVALRNLAPILEQAGLIGFVEPLGFEVCSLRFKSEAAEAITSLKLESRFRMVHDTFHHHLAGESDIFPGMAGLVHISGVTDPNVGVSDMRDSHRVLVDGRDRLGNVEQIRQLLAANPSLTLSFEPFSAEVHASADIEADLRASIAFIEAALEHAAA